LTGLKKYGFDDQTIELMKKEQAGKIVANAIYTKLEIDEDTKGASTLFDKVKDSLPGDVADQIKESISKASFSDEMHGLWDKLKVYKLADGSPDLRKMEQEIGKSYRGEKFDQVLNYIQSRAGEMDAIQNQERQVRDRSFMNEVYTYQSKGYGKAKALGLLNNYAIDAYDRALKKKVIDQLWAPPEIKYKTDPETYIDLWERVQDGEATKMEIDAAFKRGDLSVGNWEGLRKSKYTNDNKEDQSGDREVKQYIKRIANQEFRKADEKYSFITYMEAATKGKSLQEATSIIDDGLKKSGGNWFGGVTQEWKIDLQKKDSENKAWGSVYKRFGKNGKTIVDHIGQGVLLSTNKEQYSMADIENFISDIGGSSALREGSPERMAIDKLIQNKQTIDAYNVRYIIEKYHLNNVQNDISKAFDVNLEDPFKLKY
jgi:hypothetical protein